MVDRVPRLRETVPADARRDSEATSCEDIPMANTSFSGPVKVSDTFTVATGPEAALSEGGQIYVNNGANGAPIIAFSNGSAWLRVDTRGAISAT